MARPAPVLPEVGSTMVPPGFSRPSRSAASIMATAGRSFTLPPGLNSSTLARRSHSRSRPARPSRTSGVFPTRSSSESATSIESRLALAVWRVLLLFGGSLVERAAQRAVHRLGREDADEPVAVEHRHPAL